MRDTDTDNAVSPNPADLSLDELRALRQQLQHEDDVVSYARRVAQARVDLVTTEHARRTAGPTLTSTNRSARSSASTSPAMLHVHSGRSRT